MACVHSPAWSPPAASPVAPPASSTSSPGPPDLSTGHVAEDGTAPHISSRDAIGSVEVRQSVGIGGLIVDARFRPWVGGQVFECVLDDGTGQLTLAFFRGHPAIPDLEVGALISADGVVGTHRGRRIMLHPTVSFWTLDE